MVVDPWPVIATLSRIDQPLTIPSKAARTIVNVGSVPVTLLVPSTSANETGAGGRQFSETLILKSSLNIVNCFECSGFLVSVASNQITSHA